MAVIDFPASPISGQQFAVGSVVWTWDGVKWTVNPGTLSIPDAPTVGGPYGRQLVAGTMSWKEIGSGGVASDAPPDGTLYGRKNSTWLHITHTDITDWTATLGPYALITSVPLVTTITPLVNGTAAIGTDTRWARGDHIHPTDTTRYAASNPAGYQTASQVTSALGNYLPLAGGTLTGGLTGVNASFPSGVVVGAFVNTGSVTWSRAQNSANSASFAFQDEGANYKGQIYWEHGNTVVMTNGTGGAYIQLQNNNTITLSGSTGINGSLGVSTDLGVSGNVSVTGSVFCSSYGSNPTFSGSVQVNGTLSSANTIRSTNGHVIAQGNSNPGCCAYNTAGYATTFFCDVNGLTVIGDADGNGNATNYRWTLDRGSNVHIYNSLQVDGALGVSGTATMNQVNSSGLFASGTINAQGNSLAHGAFYCDNVNGSYYQRDSAGNPYMQIYCGSDNNAYWINNRTNQNIRLSADSGFRSSFDFCGKPTGGVWAATSDKRIKTVLGGYKAGLKEVLLLEPVEFIFKGNETHDLAKESEHAYLAKEKRKVVGYVADDIMKVLPETVTLHKGFLDGEKVDDLKALDMTNVTHALVNAVKELHAEVQALKAQLEAVK